MLNMFIEILDRQDVCLWDEFLFSYITNEGEYQKTLKDFSDLLNNFRESIKENNPEKKELYLKLIDRIDDFSGAFTADSAKAAYKKGLKDGYLSLLKDLSLNHEPIAK